MPENDGLSTGLMERAGVVKQIKVANVVEVDGNSTNAYSLDEHKLEVHNHCSINENDAVKHDVHLSCEAKENKPQPVFIEIKENEILCDESLIKEAKVIRCFCDPTQEEIDSGQGCGPGCINRELSVECGSRCPSGEKCSNRRIKNREYAKVEVFDAGIKGFGLRALEHLDIGRFIIEYVGEVISAEQLRRRSVKYARDPNHIHHYFMALKNGAAIDATVKGNWVVDRRLRIGFFAIKPIAVGEEIVFDYQFDRYGRKAQKCYCGAANCRGRIGEEESESEGEDNGELSDASPSFEDEDLDEEEVIVEEKKLKSGRRFVKEAKKRKLRKRQRKPCRKDFSKEVNRALSKGPPRNRDQVLDFVHLLMQVEQASLRILLLRCLFQVNEDILRLFMENAGLRLMYLILAVEYPVDDTQTVNELRCTAIELLKKLPISNKNQVVDSHLNSTVHNIITMPGPIDEVVCETVQSIINQIDSVPSSSTSSVPDSVTFSDSSADLSHLKLISSAKELLLQWEPLKEVFRIPRLDSSHTHDSQHKKETRMDYDRRVRGYFLAKKPEVPDFSKRIVPVLHNRKRRFNSDSPDLEAPQRRSRFDVVAMDIVNDDEDERMEGAMRYDFLPPPPMLLPESMFAGGLPDFSFYSYENEWGMYYDPGTGMYQQCVPYCNSQQYLPPQPVPPPDGKNVSILEAPSPPSSTPPTKTVANSNVRVLTIDMENPTDEQINLLKQTLAAVEERREQLRNLEERPKIPPPPPSVTLSKPAKWIRTTTEDGKVYYYNEETRYVTSWTLPPEAVEIAEGTVDRTDARATFKALICKHVAGLLEPMRKTKFASADDYKYVLRKLTHAVLEKELKRVGDDVELRVTESVKEKSRKYVSDYLARLGEGQYSRKNKQHNTYYPSIVLQFVGCHLYLRVLSTVIFKLPVGCFLLMVVN
uniref:[histone H3]-lysine(36) N-trimethyltransferase n=1 Tax=Syphacia muris TaxID=451379 RepID=A0A0N5ASK6_9BILA